MGVDNSSPQDEDRAKLYNTQGGYNVKALITSVEQLKSYREAFTAQEAMRRCRDVRSAYSMVNLYAGSGLDMLAGIRAMFKPIYTAEMDKAKRAALFEVSGVKSYPDVYSVPYEELHRPMYMKITPDCISYSSSNPDPRGRFGESGDNFVRVPEIVARVKPRVVLCEEVALARRDRCCQDGRPRDDEERQGCVAVPELRRGGSRPRNEWRARPLPRPPVQQMLEIKNGRLAVHFERLNSVVPVSSSTACSCRGPSTRRRARCALLA